MYFFAGVLISGLLIGMPLAFAVDLSHPPVALTGWIVFVMALCGLLSLIQFGLVKYILKPAIMDEMKGMVTSSDFTSHVNADKEFQEDAGEFMDDVRVRMGIERRHKARRKGDPQ